MPKFIVLHPVLSNNMLHDRGSEVVLSDKHGEVLQKSGHVGPPTAIQSTEEAAAVTASLDVMTKTQLVALALDKLDLVLSPTLPKAKLIEEIVLATEIAAESAAKLAKKTTIAIQVQE